MPVGRAFGEDYSNSWQIHPTLLLTIPAISNKLDINLSPKYLMTFCEDCDDFIAVNLGLAFSDDLNKWAVRPEFGLLFDPGSSDFSSHLSLGVSMIFGKNKE